MTTATLPSRTSSQTYTVTLGDDGSAACTCTAGQYGRQCWHVMKAEAERRNAAELADVFRSGARFGVTTAGYWPLPGEPKLRDPLAFCTPLPAPDAAGRWFHVWSGWVEGENAYRHILRYPSLSRW